MTAGRVPFSPQDESDGWIYTSAGRIECDACGEWIYTRRRAEGRLFAFPPECQVCGAPIPDDEAGVST